VGNGVKVVGAVESDEQVEEAEQRHRSRAGRSARGARERADGERRPAPEPSRRGRLGVSILALVAALGIAGTITFQREWSSLHGQQVTAAQARQAASTFLTDLTNFDAKSVDADFARLTAMSTGPFAKQANQFFNSSIRQQLENALASSRGQVRSLYVQSVGGGQATVYAVIDQLYVNRTLSAPQSDVLRVVVQLTDASGSWKVSDVTVLEGPSLASPSPSGAKTSAG